MSDVVIVDTGLANVGSVANMCSRLGARALVTSDAAQVAEAPRLILPGVGAFDRAMTSLRSACIDEALRTAVSRRTPLLGICLGMQLLFDESEEGEGNGLGILRGTVRRLPSTTAAGPVRLPHMGWSRLQFRDHPLTEAITEASRFYHVHSFSAHPSDDADVLATAIHGDPFVTMVAKGCVAGTQFHPEKSHRHGKSLLATFLRWTP